MVCGNYDRFIVAISRARELLIITGSNDVDRPSFNSDRSAVDFLYEYVGSNLNSVICTCEKQPRRSRTAEAGSPSVI
ncbi:unnamed protein product [Bursaphelenchus xylophilus]|uniref:(pine wood nematode) hypothetical protein n=1 Tax=Bursaphelenchus xylophilus TaxID=6326 RepID=A0A1I7S140_BURXY|nr:unnamed protein product [Bursaphelenchus xylophilus]CAG9079938.1 unnamed protein product [Bursaphelenchus xylophilus]